mgnify:CR=1 FL=1
MDTRTDDRAQRALAASDAPETDDPVTLDVRALGPPKPLTETLERLSDLEQDDALVQLNDRAPQHLYPRLGDRGFDYETTEYDDVVVTVIWHSK